MKCGPETAIANVHCHGRDAQLSDAILFWMLSPSSAAPLSGAQSPGTSARSRFPVFVVGCHRSGTNLLYDTLLSAGGFAIYRGYLPVYKILIPRCGPLSDPSNRARAIELFLRSKGFRRSGLEAAPLATKLQEGASSGGEFLRIVMDDIAKLQGAQRWAIYDPDYVLHIPRIKQDLPNALFLHIIRDGRDIALSLSKMGGFRPFPWSSSARGLFETAAYWQWVVRKGQEYGCRFPGSYLEVHYEQLVEQPHAALAKISEFLDQQLDYGHIQETGLGRLKETNSSFKSDAEATQVAPVQRWKERLSAEEIGRLEGLVGDCLEACGYSLVIPASERASSLRDTLIQSFYPAFLSAKLWAKVHTPVGRWSSLEVLELDSAPDQEAVEPAVDR
jgi:LPS sulfotransferase NodH